MQATESTLSSSVRQRRTFSPQEKANAVLRIVQDCESLSAVADDLNLQPPLLIAWRKQFFAHAATAFERPQDKELAKAQEEATRLQAKISSLEADKDRIIAAVATEVCELKKKLSAMPSKPAVGSSRMSGTKSSRGAGGSRA